MRVPEEVRQCVAYIGLEAKGPGGEPALEPLGTGFFVEVKSETTTDRVYVYLVTAAHVVEDVKADQWSIRLNNKEGGSLLLRPAVGEAAAYVKWWFHPTDKSVDVAVMPMVPPEELVDYRRLSAAEMFVTEEIIRSNSIGAGDEVFMTGLFTKLAGSKRNQPIVRTGNIAMMPDEPVPTSRGMLEAYLIEARSIGGLSGSPAFVRTTVQMGLGMTYLLGLMHGHWDIPPGAVNDLAEDRDGGGSVNMGIAVVVPARKILEVLNQPGLVELRRQRDEQLRKEREPRLDEVAPDEAVEGDS